jgi:hypothetical protein
MAANQTPPTSINAPVSSAKSTVRKRITPKDEEAFPIILTSFFAIKNQKGNNALGCFPT